MNKIRIQREENSIFCCLLVSYKTAIAGEDPNWGRVIMGIGKSGEKLIKIDFNKIR